MKMKSINKILTSVLSVSMLMGSAMPVLAAEGGVDVDAPIYSLDIMNVIVPTSYAVAFNPEGLTVKTSDSDTSEAQILSKTYGIINKSSKDKVIMVTLNVADQNTDSGITFVDSAEEITSAEDGEYKIHLTVIPADTTKVQVGSADADQTTTADALNDVTMKPAADNAVTLKGGENYIGFKLDKAKWTPKSGSELTLGESTSNNVADSFEVTGLADGGKGITAFTFGGEMNTKADWSKLTQGIKITVIYDNQNAASDLTAISGTGAMVKVSLAPTFTTGTEIGQIKYSRGAGDDGLSEIKKIEMVRASKGSLYDGYHASGTYWDAATDENGVITFDSKFMTTMGGTGDMLSATVTYETNGGETCTITVDVWRVISNVAPTFTTGNGVGQINYTPGVGNNGLKEIKKIEMVRASNSNLYDGYHASGTYWSDATDENGVITLDSKFLTTMGGTGSMASATVTYETNGGETYTASVDVKIK